MKLIFSIFAAFFVGVLSISVGAQTTAPPVAAAPAIPVKIAVIDTDQFGDTKNGIKKLLAALGRVDTMLKPIRDEATTKQTRYNALVTEIQNAQKTGANVAPAKIDEGQQLENDLKRLQEDGQKALERYTRQFAEPVSAEVSKAVEVYARSKGYDIVLDAAKFAGTMMVLNPAVDITSAFIADFNAKNPGTTAAITPVKP